jgi:hypothetical protein
MGQTESSTENFQKLQQQQKQLIPGLPDEIAMDCLVRVPYKFHSNMKLVCQSWRSLIMHPSFYQERRRSGTAEHMVCMIQPLPTPSPPPITESSASDELSSEKEEGVDEKSCSRPPLIQHGLTIFNATHQTWHRMMRASGAGRSLRIPMFCQCVALPASGKILFLGGWDPNTLEPVPDAYVLDLIGAGGARWRRAAPMSVARSFFACGIVGQSTVYVAGGHDNQKNALQSAEVYDANADEWRTLPAMAEERDECQGISWEGDSRFWVVSGYSTDSQGFFRSDAECYDPITESWSKIEGVWPYRSVSPRGVTAAVTSSSGCQWWWFLGSEQQQEENGGGKELSHDNSQMMWKVVDSAQFPSGINGGTPISVTALGHAKDQQPQRIFVMTSNGGGGRGDGTEEGAFILERESSNSNDGSPTKWNNVKTPAGFSGFPYSNSCLVI